MKNHGYIYPPRPEVKLPPASLGSFERMRRFMAQPKLNGSCAVVYIDDDGVKVWNRHKEHFASMKLDLDELAQLRRGNGLTVLVGEYMNKSQKDEHDEVWNNKFVVFDVLVHESKHLVGTTFEERYDMMIEWWPNNFEKLYLHGISDNCYRVGAVTEDFEGVFDDIVDYGMYEGLVLKDLRGKLEVGSSKKNTSSSQFKCRKPTKNYNF